MSQRWQEWIYELCRQLSHPVWTGCVVHNQHHKCSSLNSRPEESSSMDMMEGLAMSSITLLNCFLYCVDRPAITPGKGWLSSISTPWPPPWSSLIWKEAHHLLKFVGKFRTCQCIPLVFYPANTHVRLVFLALLTKNQCVKDSRPECTRWIIQQLQLLLCRFTLFYHLLQKSSLYNQYIQVIAASFHCLFILIAQTEGRKTFLWPQWYVNSKRLARFRTCRNKHSICLVQTK
jgi:hypothetical protein